MTAEVWGFLPAELPPALHSQTPRSPLHHGKLSHAVPCTRALADSSHSVSSGTSPAPTATLTPLLPQHRLLGCLCSGGDARGGGSGEMPLACS